MTSYEKYKDEIDVIRASGYNFKVYTVCGEEVITICTDKCTICKFKGSSNCNLARLVWLNREYKPEYNCGNCKHWAKARGEWGVCYYFYPYSCMATKSDSECGDGVWTPKGSDDE